jgi:hypothetical protein
LVRLALTAAVAILVLALAPLQALADSDPPSDVLLLQDVYFPYSPPVSGPVQKTVQSLVRSVHKAGYPLKVAIIASPVDLGGVPQLFNQPQSYVKFLGDEIAFNSRKPLLVIMPNGYGVDSAGPAAAGAIAGLSAPGTNKPDGLARASVDAIVRLAKASGHPVPKPKLPGAGGGGGGGTPVVVFGVPVLLLVLAGVLATIRRRQMDEPTEVSP